VFFVWQVGPSVIFGRNQLIENEVNLPYCRSHGIGTYRRKSGGGCVYADMGNLMLSCITRQGSVSLSFNRYLNMVALALYKIGVEAKVSGRNDIMIGGRKVSGNAFYRSAGHDIVHGTLLYDTDMANMTAAITPATAKLQSKGIDSVRQRVALLKHHTSIGIEQLKLHLRRTLCQTALTPTPHDIAEIEKREESYLADDFIYGRNPSYTVACRHRAEGVGDMELRLSVKNGVIKRANLLGDFFVTGDIDSLILRRIEGKRLAKEAIENALPADLGDAIMNLRRSHLAAMIQEITDNNPANGNNNLII